MCWEIARLLIKKSLVLADIKDVQKLVALQGSNRDKAPRVFEILKGRPNISDKFAGATAKEEAVRVGYTLDGLKY